MKPIWYFVGLILLIMGAVIFFTGIYQLFYPPQIQTVLANLHPDIWWGLIMFFFGLLMYVKNRNKVVE